MNERLEAFRKRLRGPEKEKDRWKFWVGSPVAWLAFFVSVGTAYYNLIRVSDDLKVVVTNHSFEPRRNSSAAGASVTVKFTGTFANNGNRPVVIVGSRMKIGNWFDLDRECDQISDYQKVEFQVKPLLVKANEAGFDVFGTKDHKGNDADQYIEQYVGPALDWTALNKVLTCLQFDVVTPDGLIASPYFTFLEIYSERNTEADGVYQRIGLGNPPMTILSGSPKYFTSVRSALASAWSQTLQYFPWLRGLDHSPSPPQPTL